LKDKLAQLQLIRSIYESGGNIIEYLTSGQAENAIEDILIAYDFQAGTYVENHNKNPLLRQSYIKRLGDFIIDRNIRGSILEAGVGEATTLISLLKNLSPDPSRFKKVCGFDISWSRIRVAKQFCRDEEFPEIFLCVGDMYSIPFADNCFDIVYTSGAIEPNGGHEKEILQELYRVAKEYIVLIEPAYEFADDEQRAYMLRRGYVTCLYQTAIGLNYDVLSYGLYGETFGQVRQLNPYGFLVIKKNGNTGRGRVRQCGQGLVCPVTGCELRRADDAYFSDGLLAYPIIGGVPCLTPQNAVVATKFEEY
jgi:ubiquinone/menaquinone biosynthesis C-methylase UbiE